MNLLYFGFKGPADYRLHKLCGAALLDGRCLTHQPKHLWKCRAQATKMMQQNLDNAVRRRGINQNVMALSVKSVPVLS